MSGDITLTIIKPGAVRHEHIGPILTKINEACFRIVAMKYLKLRVPQAQAFYSEHKGKPFFESLVDFMTSGPILVIILEKENAVEEYRKLIGSTDPEKAEEDSIRKLFGHSKQNNAVHGSDSDKSAIRESEFFFPLSERYNKEGNCYEA